LKNIAAIALGSNLDSPAAGDRAANLNAAIEHLQSLGRVFATSSFHDTAPVGYLDQPRFLNAALLLETNLSPLRLLEGLLEIERKLGRDRTATVAKGPRVIDLDLIFFDDEIMETATLTLPHLAMRERRFVLDPLAEIAPEMVDPVTGRTVKELLDRLVSQPDIHAAL
jgi:2-amino-4-hydroxy-6-hydroxymethyldihydropteridine diphosphokinase